MNVAHDTRSVLARLRALPAGHDPLALAERQAALLHYLTPQQHGPIEQRVACMPRIVVRAADIPTSGLSHWDGQQWVITINQHEPHTRQRFTVLHEYKHIIDHPTVTELYRDRRGIPRATQMERAADYFAGCALVPQPLLVDAWHGGTTGASELAALFGVSIPAVRVRLAQVGLRRARCGVQRPTADVYDNDQQPWQRGVAAYERTAA